MCCIDRLKWQHNADIMAGNELACLVAGIWQDYPVGSGGIVNVDGNWSDFGCPQGRTASRVFFYLLE